MMLPSLARLRFIEYNTGCEDEGEHLFIVLIIMSYNCRKRYIYGTAILMMEKSRETKGEK